jgi:hypothetical protein
MRSLSECREKARSRERESGVVLVDSVSGTGGMAPLSPGAVGPSLSAACFRARNGSSSTRTSSTRTTSPSAPASNTPKQGHAGAPTCPRVGRAFHRSTSPGETPHTSPGSLKLSPPGTGPVKAPLQARGPGGAAPPERERSDRGSRSLLPHQLQLLEELSSARPSQRGRRRRRPLYFRTYTRTNPTSLRNLRIYGRDVWSSRPRRRVIAAAGDA